MAGRSEHDFSERVLVVAEETQKAIGHTRLGGLLIKAITGSKSPAYVQLDWQSSGIKTTVKDTVKVLGDPQAGRLARHWYTAMMMATSEEELLELERDTGKPDERQRAIAYIADAVVHVGTHPDRAEPLLGRTGPKELGVAMRLGQSSLEATCGLWIPEEKAFVGVEAVRVVEPHIAVEDLPERYPGVSLT
jgi:hypothetical protein